MATKRPGEDVIVLPEEREDYPRGMAVVSLFEILGASQAAAVLAIESEDEGGIIEWLQSQPWAVGIVSSLLAVDAIVRIFTPTKRGLLERLLGIYKEGIVMWGEAQEREVEEEEEE